MRILHQNNRINATSIPFDGMKNIIYDFSLLAKFKLSFVVVFSSIMGYWIMAGTDVDLSRIVVLALGGFLMAGAANALNQVLEKEYDILMDRTKNRPIAAGRMKISTGVLSAGISCIIAIVLLSTFNPLTVLLSMVSLISYAFLYTPLKRMSPLSVSIGAVPGALPVLIGCTAYDNTISPMALFLFAIQFFWQFPHFWAIGYNGFDDYKKAGFNLMPTNEFGNVDRSIGTSSIIYSLALVVTTLFAYFTEIINVGECIGILVFSFIYVLYSFRFKVSFDRPSALKLMFYSFLFLPAVLLISLIF